MFLFLGNPGFPVFYVPFAKALYSATKRRFPIWIISHAGHVLAPRGKKILTTSEGMSSLTFVFFYGEWVFLFLESLLRLRVTPVEISACGITPVMLHSSNFRIWEVILIIMQVIFLKFGQIKQFVWDLPSLFTN